MIIAENLSPIAVASWVFDRSVARHVFKHLGEFNSLGLREEQAEQLGAADYRDRFSTSQPQGFVGGVSNLCSRRIPGRVTGEHKVPS